MVAHKTLLNSGTAGIKIFKGWNIERAGGHAVAAADTDTLVVKDRSLWAFLESAHQAGGDAGWLSTVITLYLTIDGLSCF